MSTITCAPEPVDFYMESDDPFERDELERFVSSNEPWIHEDVSIEELMHMIEVHIPMETGTDKKDEGVHDDFTIAKELVTLDGRLLSEVAPELRSDYNIVCTAVVENGDALEYASEKMRADRGVVIKAIGHSNARNAFKFASEELRCDPYLVDLAIEHSPTSIQWASELIRCDLGFMTYVIRMNHSSVKYIGARLILDGIAFEKLVQTFPTLEKQLEARRNHCGPYIF